MNPCPPYLKLLAQSLRRPGPTTDAIAAVYKQYREAPIRRELSGGHEPGEPSANHHDIIVILYVGNTGDDSLG